MLHKTGTASREQLGNHAVQAEILRGLVEHVLIATHATYDHPCREAFGLAERALHLAAELCDGRGGSGLAQVRAQVRSLEHALLHPAIFPN